jgi:sugar phosphate isomerase/epimerase
MKLSVSVRIAEKFDDKRQASLPLESLAKLAAAENYKGICMRASQIGIDSPPEQVKEARARLDALGLTVTMVTGDFAVPENTEDSPQLLQKITPYLGLTEALGADLIRVSLKKEEDIIWAQRAADEAAQRGIRLAQQCHTRSLFEQVDPTLEVLKRIGRSNFGIIYDPANLELCGEHYGSETIRKLAPYLFNVYLQNQRIAPDGDDVLPTWSRGDVRFHQIPMWEKGGIDFPHVMDLIAGIGYNGYVTIHQAFGGLNGPAEAIRESARYLRSICSEFK